MRVLGVDPGLTRCGVGVVDVAPNRTARLVHVEVVRTPPDQALELRLLTLGRALAALLVDYRSGVALGRSGGGVNLEVAAVGNSRVVQAKLKTIAALGLDEELEDILITLSSQYHLIRVLPGRGQFLYLVLSRKANLARARLKLQRLAEQVGS